MVPVALQSRGLEPWIPRCWLLPPLPPTSFFVLSSGPCSISYSEWLHTCLGWGLNGLDWDMQDRSVVWEVLPSCPAVGQKQPGCFFQSVAGCPFSAILFSLDITARGEEASTKPTSRLARNRVWKSPPGVPLAAGCEKGAKCWSFHGKEVVRILCIQDEIPIGISLQICSIFPFGLLLYVIKHFFNFQVMRNLFWDLL